MSSNKLKVKAYPGLNKLAQPVMNFGSLENSRMANKQKRTNTACSANLFWNKIKHCFKYLPEV